MACGSKETAVEKKNLKRSGCVEFGTVLKMLDSFFSNAAQFPLKMCCL
jgi:hypothetical protein